MSLNPSNSEDGRHVRLLMAGGRHLQERDLESFLTRAGYEIELLFHGERAWQRLESPEAPRLAILDWHLPGVSSTEVCRRVRARCPQPYTYLILVDSPKRPECIRSGLAAGADDIVAGAFELGELLSRIRVGERVLRLESRLNRKVKDLEEAATLVRDLQGLVSICPRCKRVRGRDAAWHRFESYVEKRSKATFTHSLCQSCIVKHYPDYADPTPGEPSDPDHGPHAVSDGLDRIGELRLKLRRS